MVEVSLAVALLVGAGLTLRSFSKISDTNTGIDPENVLAVRINLPEARYPEAEARNVFGSDNTACVWISGTENVLQGNYVGTDITGTVALNAAGFIGVLIGEAPNALDTAILDNVSSSSDFGSLHKNAFHYQNRV